MNTYEASAKTVEEAISEGLNKLNLSIGEVDVEILDEGSKGLFGMFGSKPARVRLTAKEQDDQDARSIFQDSLSTAPKQQPQRAAAPRAPREPREPREQKPARLPREPQQPKAEKAEKAERPAKQERPARPERAPRGEKPRAPRAEQENLQPREPAAPPTPAEQKDPATREGKVQAFLQKLTGLMGVNVSVHVHTDEEGNIRVNMEGDPLGILIGRRGETLDALQYLTSLHLNRGEEGYIRVTLDSEGYRAKREDALVRLANRMAMRAQKTGRRVSMEPMNPYERRILHSALQNHPGISTHSEGEEPNRHVVITLNKDGTVDSQEASE